MQIVFTAGLLAALALIYGFYRLGIAGVATIDPSHTTTQLARAFAHTLIPIALAYVIAHYFGLLAYQGQAIAHLASDPLGDGANLLGTADKAINYSWISASSIWYIQVITLVTGHAIALALAHDRALELYGDTRDGVRSQYWMLTVMIGFTTLALWLLSSQG